MYVSDKRAYREKKKGRDNSPKATISLYIFTYYYHITWRVHNCTYQGKPGSIFHDTLLLIFQLLVWKMISSITERTSIRANRRYKPPYVDWPGLDQTTFRFWSDDIPVAHRSYLCAAGGHEHECVWARFYYSRSSHAMQLLSNCLKERRQSGRKWPVGRGLGCGKNPTPRERAGDKRRVGS